ncbi:peptidylprolyl isomerase [Candidatus Woesearchaeota archaeon CG10_big_fil_rev_8_21_14_0_10_36_11]|nr:MAG: peptidylprolyl isomerase [Candidatus Woesearchaeota archaeon CG10_big_fil_rev_8_21_14_0_10_36_11]
MTETIKKGDIVQVEYTGKLDDGSVFDTSKGKAPLAFKIGSKQVIPGFEKEVEGMNVGEEKTFTIASDEAYGPIHAEMTQEVPRDKLPKEPTPQVGMMLVMQAPNGQQIPAKIVNVTEDKVTIDLNHPLAGKDLTFTVKIVGVNEPEDENDESESSEETDDEDADECGSCDSCQGCH